MFEEYPDIMNFDQFRKSLGIGKNTAYYLLKTNQIQHFTIGNSYKIPKLCVENYINQQVDNDRLEA